MLTVFYAEIQKGIPQADFELDSLLSLPLADMSHVKCTDCDGLLSSLFEHIILKSIAATREVGLGSAEACTGN